MPYYRLLIGRHQEARRDENGELVGEKDKDGRLVPEEVTYVAGDTFFSPQNLLRFNGAGMTPKFELLNEFESAGRRMAAANRSTSVAGPEAAAGLEHGTAGVEQPGPDVTTSPAPRAEQLSPAPSDPKEYRTWLESQSVKQLHEHAADEEIDVGNAVSKTELVNRLASARGTSKVAATPAKAPAKK